MTVTQIAKLANVSIATVDRVLHNRGRVALETKAKIEKIIKDSGYQPDPLARHLKNRSHYKIGILMPEITSAFGYWQLVYDGIKNAIEQEFSAFSLTLAPFFFKRTDNNSLKEAFEKMICDSCSAYIIAPILQDEISKLLKNPRIKEPYCFLDSSLPGCKPLCEIAQNPRKAGFLVGRLTEIFSKKDGTFIVIKPHSGAYNLDQRALGFCDWFERDLSGEHYAKSACDNGNERDMGTTRSENVETCEKANISETHRKNVAVTISQNLIPETIEKEIKNILTKYPNTVGICSVSVEVSLISKVIERLGLKNEISITGFDLVGNNRECLLKGLIDALIDQKPYEQGVLAVRQLFKKLVYEEDVEHQIDMPIEIFLKENV